MNVSLKERAKRLGMHGVIARWDEYENEPWLEILLATEEESRAARSFERKVKNARLGQFKHMAAFDWNWPERIDREQIEDLFTLEFLRDHTNVVLLGTNGLGKTMIAQNLAHTALTQGIAARFVKASDMLNELVECDGSRDRRRALKKWCNYPLLVVDEIGYRNYDARFADLLYEVISGRYQRRSTIVTTNKSFRDWGEVFPNAACVVTLVDRLVHNAEAVDRGQLKVSDGQLQMTSWLRQKN